MEGQTCVKTLPSLVLRTRAVIYKMIIVNHVCSHGLPLLQDIYSKNGFQPQLVWSIRYDASVDAALCKRACIKVCIIANAIQINWDLQPIHAAVQCKRPLTGTLSLRQALTQR